MEAGIYRHYRNGELYLYLGRARHSETGESFAVYVPLYRHEGEGLSIRPYRMFCEEVQRVDPESGHVVQVERFRYLGDAMTAEDTQRTKGES